MKPTQTIEQITKIIGEDYFVQTVPLYPLINEFTQLVQIAVREFASQSRDGSYQDAQEFAEAVNCECNWRAKF